MKISESEAQESIQLPKYFRMNDPIRDTYTRLADMTWHLWEIFPSGVARWLQGHLKWLLTLVFSQMYQALSEDYYCSVWKITMCTIWLKSSFFSWLRLYQKSGITKVRLQKGLSVFGEGNLQHHKGYWKILIKKKIIAWLVHYFFNS